LTPEEKGNIAVFESSKGSVVYISTSEQVLDAWTLRVQTVPHGTGSGFIWDSAGHIVTNLHVIADASVAKVRLADGKDYPATLIGVSRVHDIAVLQIRIPPVPRSRFRSARVTISRLVRKSTPSATRSASTGR
jgi:S1-C subfamily serine protease